MVDIVKVGLSVDSREVDKGARSLNKLGKEGHKTRSATDKMSQGFKGLGSTIAALGLGALLRDMVKTAASFETMAISLEVVTGSAEKAQIAMAGITEFAKNTPFQVSEITDAFIKLKSLGIDPTEARLRSFGDTSSAMGKSLNQMIEAVADAATGEFERLKEFGIKARSEGDNVSFTFQGITKTVKKSSKEITEYLEDIGKTKFAGAMEKQMNTLNGKISNLGDSFDALSVKLLQDNSGGKGLLDYAISAVDFLTSGITSVRIGIVEMLGGFDKFFLEVGAGAEAFAAHVAAIWTSGEDTRARIDNIQSVLDAEKKAIDEAVEAYIAGEEIKKDAKIGAAGIDIAGAGAVIEDDQDIWDAKKQTDLDRLLLKYIDERTLLEEKAIEDQLIIDEAYVMGEISAETHEQTMTDIAEKYSKQRKKLNDIENKTRLQSTQSMLGNLSLLMESKSKKMFEVGKAAAIANTIITTYSSAQKSYDAMADIPYVGPILGGIAAAAAIAVGVQRVNAIQSTSFGSKSISSTSGAASGSAPTMGSLPPEPSAPPEKTGQQVNITLEGSGYTRENVRELIQGINEEIGDGATLMVTT